MTYLLAQKELTPPTAEQLKRAFKLVKGLTDADATKLANDAYGILIKNLSQEDACLLQRTLAAEGVATEVIESGQFPKLVDPKFVRRAELNAEALVVQDPLGRPLPLPWAHVALIAAGRVQHFGMNKTTTEERVMRYDPVRGLSVQTVVETRHKVAENAQWLVDIFLAGGALRFQIEAANFMFKHTFDRPELDLAGKVGLLVQLLSQHAPHAALNRGAFTVRVSPDSDFAYAGKNYLFEESNWLLWRLAQAVK